LGRTGAHWRSGSKPSELKDDYTIAIIIVDALG
jgi:hypothetical protein